MAWGRNNNVEGGMEHRRSSKGGDPVGSKGAGTNDTTTTTIAAATPEGGRRLALRAMQTCNNTCKGVMFQVERELASEATCSHRNGQTNAHTQMCTYLQ